VRCVPCAEVGTRERATDGGDAMTTDASLLVRCRCGDLAHITALSFDVEYDDCYDVSIVIPWMPWRWRLQQLWRVLRGRAGTVTFVSLSPEDIPAIVEHMQSFLGASRVAVMRR
jgi:hypothetical protein